MISRCLPAGPCRFPDQKRQDDRLLGMAMEADLPSVDVSVPHAKAAVGAVEKNRKTQKTQKILKSV